MKKQNSIRLLTVVLGGLVLIATMMSGCISGGDGEGTPRTLTVTGSTTVLPIAEQAAEAFMEKDASADIQVSGGGSSVGVQAVGEGTADIGMSSRDLKDAEKEKYPDLVRHVIARDGIALIVHKDNPVTSLTLDQVKAIYKGEIASWSEVGGEENAIVVIGRDSASGTREFFFESVMNKEDFVATQLEKNSNGAVKQTVAQTPGAIGYVGLGYVDDAVSGIKIDVDGTLVEPTVENVIACSYPIARNLNMFTNGPASGLAQEYLDFITGPEGQALVEEEGFVPL